MELVILILVVIQLGLILGFMCPVIGRCDRILDRIEAKLDRLLEHRIEKGG